MRHRPKKDANHDEIVSGLRQAGRSVFSLAAMGDGCPDLLCGNNGETFLLEVKTSTGKLTPDELMWIDSWRGQVTVVRTLEEALRATGLPFE